MYLLEFVFVLKIIPISTNDDDDLNYDISINIPLLIWNFLKLVFVGICFLHSQPSYYYLLFNLISHYSVLIKTPSPNLPLIYNVYRIDNVE